MGFRVKRILLKSLEIPEIRCLRSGDMMCAAEARKE
jgi:hypothetical protein